MISIKSAKIYISSALLIGGVLLALTVFADQSMLPTARVSYHPDGGVSITYFLTSACQSSETETQCIDRVFSTNPLEDLPYDDVAIDQLPKDRKYRDKWRGEKGRGIWIDDSLVTKNEKIEELQEQLEAELEKENLDTAKILRLQHQLEKAKDIKNSVLTQEDLSKFEERQKSFLAAAVTAISDAFSSILNSIKEGFLALKNLVADKIQVGTSEKPSGITTYDHETGEPYCLVVKKGKVESIPGECGSAEPSNPSSSSNSSSSNSNQPSDQATNQPSNQATDSEPPTITLNGLNPTEIEIGSTYSDQGATVSDNINQNLGYKIILKKKDGDSYVILSGSEESPEIYPNELILDTPSQAEYTIIYTAVDQAGNIGTATRIVRVTPNASEGSSEDPSPSQSGAQNDNQGNLSINSGNNGSVVPEPVEGQQSEPAPTQ